MAPAEHHYNYYPQTALPSDYLSAQHGRSYAGHFEDKVYKMPSFKVAVPLQARWLVKNKSLDYITKKRCRSNCTTVAVIYELFTN